MSVKIIGSIISTYTQSQSVKDGTTVEIQYEGRLLGQHIIKNIQQGFDEITESLSEDVTAAVGKKWSDFVTLVEREERMKENCKCQKEHPNNTCRCGHSKGESSFTQHFNEIFNRK